MNKRDRKTILTNTPNMTARTTTYKGYSITRYTEVEGSRYVVQTLTGHSVCVTRKFVDARNHVDQVIRSAAHHNRLAKVR